MQGVFDIPEEFEPVQAAVLRVLEGVERRFDAELGSDLPPVRDLVQHVARYRGKMLRPTIAALCALAARDADIEDPLPGDVEIVATVVEMVHMATLVHDDVLDEADVRRRAATLNRLRGNEAAVILGDYLIAAAFRLCSTATDRRAAVEIGERSMDMCAGELLQLHHRDDLALDEATYLEILSRKTGALVAAATVLGARAGTGHDQYDEVLQRFGRALGVAFQVQDDLLDLTGEQATVGKSVAKDLEKTKLTLPLIHHLANASPTVRGESIRLLAQAAREPAAVVGDLRARLEDTGSVGFAEAAARRLAGEAEAALIDLPDNHATGLLRLVAAAVVGRNH